MYFLRKYIFFDLAEKSFFSIFPKNRKTHFVQISSLSLFVKGQYARPKAS